MSISSKILSEVPLHWQASTWNTLGRLVQHKKLPHSIFLKGIAQSGKTYFATAFAQLLLCETPQLISNSHSYKSCQICHACRLFQANTHPNYHYITPLRNDLKKTIIPIEIIRTLTATLQKTAWSSDSVSHVQPYHTVVIIDPADALQTAASNALLKTLEEPMPGIVFILLSSNAHIVPATIKSRCHTIMLPVPSFNTAYTWLSEKTEQIQSKVDISNIKASLQITDNNPLQGFTLLRKNRIEQTYKVIFKSFISLINPLINPSDVAQLWSKQPTDIVFDSLMQMTTWLIRMQLGEKHILDNLKIAAADLTELLAQKNIIFLLDYLEIIKTVRADARLSHLNILLCSERLTYYFTK